jgi:hypothetical protein
MRWSIETLNATVDDEIAALAPDLRARLSRIGRVIIVRVFVKKTQKTPRREIELALARAKEVLG